MKRDCRKPIKQSTNNYRPKQKDPSENKDALLVSVMSAQCQKSQWFVDSGATAHMSPNKNLFNSLEENRSLTVTVANNEVIHSEGIGNINLKTDKGEKVVNDVVFVRDIKANILSVSKITEKGHSVVFDSNKCTVYSDDKTVVVTASKKNDLYILDEKTEQSSLSAKPNSRLWHERLGHLNRIGMDLLKKGMASGISYSDQVDE